LRFLLFSSLSFLVIGFFLALLMPIIFNLHIKIIRIEIKF
jgi:hypothetical protein